ncbi:MAG TPA: CoA transferase [Acidimicrobiales bacterium]|jgi:crotonobetainyl-CoA:carnitine CoA-transferase CaiB-like acyl-CoA transferase|nr:CoA transferase [Acidimicrobiales bacterium]
MLMQQEAATDIQAGPLAGLRILDFSNSPAGAQASQTLSDFGAEVVQVEPPAGSRLRSMPSFPFIARGKKSIVLDLHDPEDVAVARDLALGADVLIETFRPGVMDRLGLGYDSLKSENDGLIYGSVTAFGTTGPYAGAKGYEALVMARIGALWASGGMVTRDGPAHVSVPFCSYGASQTLLVGTLAALHERESSGLGQRVETSLVKGVAAMGTWNWYLRVITSKYPEAFTPSAPISEEGVPLSPMMFMLLIGIAKDGRWLQFSQVQLHLYVAMLKAMGLDWMLEDDAWKGAAFAADPGKTGEFWDQLITAVQSKSLAEWQEVFEKDHDVWAETMRRGSELLDHPQMRHLGATVELHDDERGLVRQPGPIAQLSATPALLGGGPPRLDADGGGLRAAPWPARSGSNGAADRGSRALGDVMMLELGTFFAAPFGGTVFRELGARVIKVEPIDGEPMRNLLPFPEVGAAKAMQGKESIAVDLSSDEGRAIVHELARRADVVLQSFRAGVAERQGVDSETLRALNPDLVYLNAPGYGIDGPCGDRPAYAPTIGAGSGLVMRNIGTSIPECTGLTVAEIRANARRLAGAGTTEYAQADGISALTVASALALGLLVRDRKGVAQTMLTTMLTSTAHALADDVVEHEGRVPTPVADADLHGYGARYRLYESSDGWIYLAAPAESEWPSLVEALVDDIDLASDERFEDETLRHENDSKLAEILTTVFRAKPGQQWEDRLLAHDVGCMVAHTEPPEAVLQSEEFAVASDLLVEVDHPTFGTHMRLKPLVEFSVSESVAEPGCLLGQHTDRILAELGYDEAAIADLRKRGVVA